MNTNSAGVLDENLKRKKRLQQSHEIRGLKVAALLRRSIRKSNHFCIQAMKNLKMIVIGQRRFTRCLA